MTAVIWAAGVFGVLATALHLVSIAVAIDRCRKRRRPRSPAADAPAVSLVRPLCGIDNFLEQTLRSSFELDYPRYEIIFCVALANDPVVPLVGRIMADHPHVAARLLIGNERISDNPKLNNIAKGWRGASFDWIVIADSNVLMPPDYLQRLMATWQERTGLVCSPPVGCRPANVWAELECAFLNTYQTRWQYFADTIGSGFAQGKTMLWRREDLDQAGGPRALGSELAEDAAATKIVRRAGRRVRLVDGPFGQPLGVRSAAEVWARQVRWARLRRATFKLCYAPEILTASLWPLIAAALVAAAMDVAIVDVVAALAAVWYAAEALLARAAGWHLSARSPFLWMMRDLLLPALWIAGFIGNDFIWRGNHMRVAAGPLVPR